MGVRVTHLTPTHVAVEDEDHGRTDHGDQLGGDTQVRVDPGAIGIAELELPGGDPEPVSPEVFEELSLKCLFLSGGGPGGGGLVHSRGLAFVLGSDLGHDEKHEGLEGGSESEDRSLVHLWPVWWGRA